MEMRKIQKTGGSTYLISLPIEWVKRLKLKQGDHLLVVEKKDGTLLLDPRYEERDYLKKAELKPNKNISIDITAKYLAGYDIIKIISSERISSEMRDIIKKTKERLIGVEIVEESANEITMNCLISPAIVPLNKTLKRLHLLSLNMHEDALKSLIDMDLELARNVINRDEEVDRLYFLFVREIRTAIQDPRVADKIGVTPIECLDYRMIAKNLENIADLAVKIAEVTIKLEYTKISKLIRESIKNLSKLISDIHKEAAQALFKNDADLAYETMDKRKHISKLLEKANADLMAEPKNIAVNVDVVLDNIERIADYAVDVAEFVIRP
ncbi:MAG: PhoU domain-containing protein [Candidatus Odinarchaeia archaeon]